MNIDHEFSDQLILGDPDGLFILSRTKLLAEEWSLSGVLEWLSENANGTVHFYDRAKRDPTDFTDDEIIRIEDERDRMLFRLWWGEYEIDNRERWLQLMA